MLAGGAVNPLADRGVIRTWNLDWACRRCERYGNVPVQVTGGPLDPGTGKPTPRTSDEDLRRQLWEAHRAASPLCVADDRIIGEMWRWERTNRGTRMIFMERRGGVIKDYRWPPWAGAKKGHW